MLQNGILKINHLLSNELFKRKEISLCWGDKRSHDVLGYCSKWKMLLLTCVQTSRIEGCWLTMNLAAMTKATKA
jgi:hypothetical protein